MISCEDGIVVCVEDWYCQQLQRVQTEDRDQGTVQLAARSKRTSDFGRVCRRLSDLFEKSGEYSPDRFHLTMSKRSTINSTNDQVRAR